MELLKDEEIEERISFIEKYENTMIKMEEKIEELEEFKKDCEIVFKRLIKLIDKLEGKS